MEDFGSERWRAERLDAFKLSTGRARRARFGNVLVLIFDFSREFPIVVVVKYLQLYIDFNSASQIRADCDIFLLEYQSRFLSCDATRDISISLLPFPLIVAIRASIVASWEPSQDS